jgi:hypothetical protein
MNNKITVTISVNGQPTQVEANPNQTLQSVVNQALQNTNNTGQPNNSWQLRNEAGDLLNLTDKVGEIGYQEGMVLYFSPKTGVAG